MTVEETVSKLNHDLRNALSVIYSYAQVLELSLQKPALKEEHTAAEELLRSVEAMEAMLAERVAALRAEIK